MIATVLSLLVVAAAFLNASPINAINRRQSSGSSCTTNGQWACSTDGTQLLECAYISSTALAYATIETCSSGTVCSVSGIIGCVAGSAPTKTTTTTTTTTTATSHSTTASHTTTTTTTTRVTTTTTTTTSTSTAPSSSARKVVYIDNTAGGLSAADLAVPGYANNDYNYINLGFWLDAGAWDTAVTWVNLDSATRQSYVNAYHAAGKKILITAFGAAEWPTSGGVNPVTSAQNLAAFVVEYSLDGADIDWEDNNAMDAGTGEAWLITFMQTLRPLLPSPQYIISHAPQAPYFIDNTSVYKNNAYIAVNAAVGSLIDFYNVQFYNQGANTPYNTCTTLLTTSGGDWPGTSLFEIAGHGVPLSKLVIGKPITQAGASNTGYTDPTTLASCIAQAVADGWDAGVMGWQFTLDPTGSWIAQVAAAL
ncbi:hypothetical protein HK100_003415 [Physocladia obscura]|uniref:GH18 domain-containing protein n=1 Tax=Physocladia obscura TaxID=109957 RepID=A0AAD5SWY0_9FUNG|nr:hypothetical protein HK100_003415 [Physocladia obscura]